ncbi:hypothetical protein [Saccharopolyspora sp. NPDC050642]|uniref:hypothetical protein n=1 Tax=Saccharopolyspora sp. NPDC050642 TaxID=3157099 RepID=UPI0033D7B64D
MVTWAGQSFAYDLPANTAATFAWGGATAHAASAGGDEAAAPPVGATRRDGRRRAA